MLIAGGLVHWPQALVTIAASILGGYFGVSVARRIPVKNNPRRGGDHRRGLDSDFLCQDVINKRITSCGA